MPFGNYVVTITNIRFRREMVMSLINRDVLSLKTKYSVSFKNQFNLFVFATVINCYHSLHLNILLISSLIKLKTF